MAEHDTIYALVSVVILLCPFLTLLYLLVPNKYMEEQKEFNSDKVLLLNAMQSVMGERYQDFSYLVGYYFKSRYESYTYIVAFRTGEMIVMPYRMNWERIEISGMFPAKVIKSKVKPKEIVLNTDFGVRKNNITIPRVAESRGYRRTCFPLGIYQSDTVDELTGCLGSL